MASSRQKKRRRHPPARAGAVVVAPGPPAGAAPVADAGAPRGASRWPALLLILAGLLTYAYSLDGPFMFDDIPAIAESGAVRAWPDVAAAIQAEPESPFASRPLVSLTFALNYDVHGLDVAGYHAVNLALHIGAGLLLLGVLRRTFARTGGVVAGRADGLALAAAAIWLVHPLNSEVVNYLTQRTESLMAVCYLLTLYAGIRALDDDRPGRWYALAIVACAMGMASKESMVTAPLMVILYDRVFVFRSFRDALARRSALYAGLVATLAVLGWSMWLTPRTMSTGFATAESSVWIYLLNQTVMITRYLRLAIWPDALVLYYGWSQPVTLGAVLPYAVFIVGLVAATVVALVRRPMLGFVGVWFFITLAPASSIVAIASEVGAERRMYLPMMALAALAATGGALAIDRLRRDGGGRVPAWAPTALVAGLCLCLAAVTRARTAEYASPLTMAETVLDRWPTPMARHMVGSELVAAGRSEEAIEILADATAGYPPAHFDYGTALFNVGRLDDAEREFRAFLRLEPGSPYVPRARAALGRTLARQGRLQEAAEELERAMAATPGNIEIRGLLADAYFQQQDFARAIPLYRDFLAANPGHPGAEANLAMALAATGAEGDALATFRRLVEADPRNVEARLNLAAALVDADNLAEAETHAAEAARLDPASVIAHDLHGRILAGVGKVPAAIAAFERALAIDPEFTPAREALRVIRGG